jgi:hypothetical protein
MITGHTICNAIPSSLAFFATLLFCTNPHKDSNLSPNIGNDLSKMSSTCRPSSGLWSAYRWTN